MLNVLRSNLKHLKWILVVVAASLTLYLGAYFDFSGTSRRGSPDSDWAAWVDDTKIPTETLQRDLVQLEESYKQQFQGQFDAIRKQLRLPQMVLNSLINNELILREARRLGLSVSPAEVASEIYAMPVFRNPQGGFIGKERYAQLLAVNNRTVSGFEREIANNLLAEKWKSLVSATVIVTPQEVEQEYRQQAQTVSIESVAVPPGRWPAPEPSEAEARAWFESNPGRYRTEDGRAVAYVLIEPPAAMPTAATEQETRQYYDANISRFQRPAQRRARHILLKPQAETPEADAAARAAAEALAGRLKTGGDFAAAAAKESQDPGSATRGGDLGWFGRGAMVPEFDEAVFAARPNEIVGPVRTSFGYHIIEVTGDRPAGTTPFEEVREGIAQQLGFERRSQEVADRARKFVSAVTDPGRFEEIAHSQGLTVRTAESVFRDAEIPGIGREPALTQEILRAPQGPVGGPVQVARGVVVFRVTGVVPAAKLGFDQLRLRVTEDLRRERARDQALGSGRRELAAAGGTLAGLAAKLGLTVQKSGPLRRGDPIPGVPASPEIEKALFEAPPGPDPIVLAAGDGTVLVARVTDRGTPTAGELEARGGEIREGIRRRKSTVVWESFVRQMRAQSKIRMNDALIERLNS